MESSREEIFYVADLWKIKSDPFLSISFDFSNNLDFKLHKSLSIWTTPQVELMQSLDLEEA